jgi:hypothetical protein
MLDLRDLTTLEGRILVHGEEESCGRNYLLLEGTDARVHYMHYTAELEAARNRGGLRTELGDAELILRNKLYLRETARQLARRGIVPPNDDWDGWLGRYQRALQDTVTGRHRDKARDFAR